MRGKPLDFSASNYTHGVNPIPAPISVPIPIVWLIEPYRAGERNQAVALAEAMAWPYETKRLSYRKYEFLTTTFRRNDLRGIRLDESDQLRAPWPDLVITSGMRNEPVCRWIRDQSGGRTRIVHVGNPWADPERFELVITTPQYRIPQRANVLQNALTLNGVTTESLNSVAGHWSQAFAQLPKPFTVVVVGGHSGPFTLGEKAARRLALAANDRQKRVGGSILLTTSSRTPTLAAAVLSRELSQPNFVYQWREGDQDNPYFGLLAVADELIVTGDSISMLAEACTTGKPVHMFDLGVGRFAMRFDAEGSWRDNDWRLGGILYRLLMRFVWQKLSRDIRLVHRNLITSGRAQWFPHANADPVQGGSDLASAVAAVQSLFE